MLVLKKTINFFDEMGFNYYTFPHFNLELFSKWALLRNLPGFPFPFAPAITNIYY